MLRRIGAAERVFWFIDFDGTLVPIVRRPELVDFDAGRQAALAHLAGLQKMRVTVISGRPLADVSRLIGIPTITCAGNHGLEIAGAGIRFRHPGGVSARASLEGVKRGWIETASRYERPFFVWVHFPATSNESAPPLRGVGLRELDAYVRGLVDAARPGVAPTDADPISPGIAFVALTGADARAEARPLDIERVRVPLIWSPPGGVLPQRLLAPVKACRFLLRSAARHNTGPEAFAADIKTSGRSRRT